MLDLVEAEALAASILGDAERAAACFRTAFLRADATRWPSLQQRVARTLERFPESPGLQFDLAEVSIAQEIEPDKSVHLLQAAHRTIRPDVTTPAAVHPVFGVLELYEYLGNLLFESGRYSQAIEVYRLAVAENLASRELREMLWNSKKHAILQAEDALARLDPQQVDGRQLLDVGSWHVQFGFPFGVQRALGWFVKAAAAANCREAGLIGQATCQLALGAPGPALLCLETIDDARNDPALRPTLLELKGRAYEGLGQYGKAAESFSRLLAEYPDHPESAAFHARLGNLQSHTELIWEEPQSLLPELSLMDLFESKEV